MAKGNLPVSAVIVCFNEAKLLPDCVKSVGFCQQIIVVDLGSSDDSRKIADLLGAEVISEKHVPIGEMMRKTALSKVRHDWVLFIDPDERISSQLADSIVSFIKSDPESIGTIRVPLLNFFKNKPLRGTVWGGASKMKYLIMHKKRADINPAVHSEFFLLHPGQKSHEIKLRNNNFLHHYWSSSYKDLLEKHQRYLKLEGKARYDRRERFGPKVLLKSPFVSFNESFFRHKGYKDGFRGLLLSILWSWYNFSSILSLRKYQKAQRG